MRKMMLCLTILLCGMGESLMAQVPSKIALTPSSVPEVQRCAATQYMEQLMEDEDFRRDYQERRAAIEETAARQSNAPCTNPLIIPIAVHYNTPIDASNVTCLVDAAQAQIDQLNLDYSSSNANAAELCSWIEAGCTDFGGNAGLDAMPEDGACIQFCLADQNFPAGENTLGGYAITVGDYTWNSGAGPWTGYVNFFISSNAAAGHGFGAILGLAPLGGASNPNGNGVFVAFDSFGSQTFGGCTSGGALDSSAPYDGGATMTHELGHYFGLEHTFSDNLGDTPPQSGENYGCPTVNTTNCTSTATYGYSANFMDYVDDDCMSNFSADQVALMNTTAAAQATWATNSISCYADWQSGANTYSSTQGSCGAVCPSAVTTMYTDTGDFCETSGTISLSTDYTALTGLVIDETNDLSLSWSTGGYLSAGGTAIANPTTIAALTATGCTVTTETYYLNIDCASTPLGTTLDGGTYVVTVYPGPPTDISTLVTVTGENLCTEPVITPIAGCATYINVTADAGNPTFPVASGSGTADYTVAFVPNPAGPDCCTAPASPGDLITDGDLENAASWTQVTEIPPGTPSAALVIDATGNLDATGNEAWFGGFGENTYTAISQAINIPATCTEVNLTFDVLGGSCNNTANEGILFSISIGGVPVAAYTCQAVNGSALPIEVIGLGVPTGATTILFEATETGTSGATFIIDNIVLDAVNCPVSTNCETTVTANYDCGATACPVVTTAISGSQDVCNGAAPTALPAFTDVTLDDASLADGTLYWYTDAALGTAYVAGNVTFGGADNCASDAQTLYAAVQCTSTSTFIAAGSYDLVVYPDYDATLLTTTLGDCTTAPNLTSTCNNYTITSTAGNLTSAPGAGVSGNNTYMVTWTAACISEMVTVAYDCPIACPVVTTGVSGSENVCNGAAPTSLPAYGDVVMDDASLADGTLYWYTDAALGTAYAGGNAAFGGGDNCASETQTLYAAVVCNDNGSVIAAGSYDLVVYPDYDATLLTSTLGDCTTAPDLTSSCANYTITPDGANITAAPGAGVMGMNSYTVTWADACISETVTVSYNCGIACPVVTTGVSGSENVCNGAAPTSLPAYGDVVMDDASLADGTLYWYTDAALGTAYAGGNAAFGGGDNCASETQTLYAAVVCNDNGSVIAAGSYDLVVYPDYDATLLTSTLGDCTTAPDLTSSCANYTITPDGANITAAPGAGVMGMNSYTVTWADACISETVTVSYNCGIACPVVTTGVSGSENVCNGAAPTSLPAYGDVVMDDASLADGTLYWYTDAALGTAYAGGNAAFGGGDNCASETQTLYAAVVCNDNGSVIAAGSYDLVVYPSYDASLLIPTLGDCTTTPSLTSSCASYTIAADPGNITAPPASGASGVNTYTITWTDACISETVTVGYNCGVVPSCAADCGSF